MVKTAFEVIQR